MGFPVAMRLAGGAERGGLQAPGAEPSPEPSGPLSWAPLSWVPSVCACSPAPVEMLSLKLRRPAFSDDIDLNATFDVDTPPARPPGLQHGHAKKLCPEKAQ